MTHFCSLSVYRLLREVTKSSTASLNAELTEEAEAARKRLEEALVWLHRFLDAPETSAEKDRASYHRARAFQLLLAHLGVLLYAGDEDVPSLIEVRN